jgi:hypothetical protein
MTIKHDRRQFLASAAVAAGAGVLGARVPLAAERPLETTSIGTKQMLVVKTIRTEVADTFLRAEGFTEVQYVRAEGGFSCAARDAGTPHSGITVARIRGRRILEPDSFRRQRAARRPARR